LPAFKHDRHADPAGHIHFAEQNRSQPDNCDRFQFIAMAKTNPNQLFFPFVGTYKAKHCRRKTGFVTEAAAALSGQRYYWCSVCQLYHRTGPVLPLSNPVLPGSFSLSPTEQNQIRKED
jgi:hypothetical protein